MSINGQPLRKFLFFWFAIPAPDEGPVEKRPPEFQPGWAETQRSAIAPLSNDQLEVFTADWQRQGAANESTQASAESRANGLLVVVGLLNGLAAVAATSLTGSWLGWVAAFVVAGIALLYSALATAFLAVRVGQVKRWTRVNVTPDEMRNDRLARVERAHQVYVAVRRNRYMVAMSVGYLRDAQTFALVTVAALALLATASTAAALTKPTTQAPVRVEIILVSPVPSIGSILLSPSPSPGAPQPSRTTATATPSTARP